jgi:hypothetical protein
MILELNRISSGAKAKNRLFDEDRKALSLDLRLAPAGKGKTAKTLPIRAVRFPAFVLST